MSAQAIFFVLNNKTMENQLTSSKEQIIISSQALLDHWQGHRRLTRRVIDAFSDGDLFNYSIGGMRPFSEWLEILWDLLVPE